MCGDKGYGHRVSATLAGIGARLRARLHDETGQALVWGIIVVLFVAAPLTVLALGDSDLGVVRSQAQTAADAATLAAVGTAQPAESVSVQSYTSTCVPPHTGTNTTSSPVCSWSGSTTATVFGSLPSLFRTVENMPGWASRAGCTAMAGQVPSMPWAGRACVSATKASSVSWQYPNQDGLPYDNAACAAADQYLAANLPGTPYVVTNFTTTPGTGEARMVLRVEAPPNAGFFSLANHGKPVWVTVVSAARPTIQTPTQS